MRVHKNNHIFKRRNSHNSGLYREKVDGIVWCQVLIHISIPIKMCTEILLEKNGSRNDIQSGFWSRKLWSDRVFKGSFFSERSH